MGRTCPARSSPLPQEHLVNQPTDTQPGVTTQQDSLAQTAPDPRAHYDSPESLAEDSTLNIEQREVLLREWKYDLEQRLGAVSEGMAASTPGHAPDQAQLSAELRRATQAWDTVAGEVKLAAVTNPTGRS